MLARVRAICTRLPEVEEIVDGHGHIAFQVRGKSFVRMNGQDNELLSLKADLETQEFLVTQGDYVKSAYIGQHGWVTHKEDLVVDWAEAEGLIREAYKLAAPKRLGEQLDSPR